jgi:hypothetical protein
MRRCALWRTSLISTGVAARRLDGTQDSHKPVSESLSGKRFANKIQAKKLAPFFLNSWLSRT